MNYVVRIFQNKAHSWQVHNTLQDGFDYLQISAGTNVSTSDRIELSVHDEASRVILKLQLLLKSYVDSLMPSQKFKVLYCFVKMATEEKNLPLQVCLFIMGQISGSTLVIDG